MNTKLIITEYEKRLTNALFCDDQLTEVNFMPEGGSILNNIYIGRVSKVVKNINAAFVRIADGKECFMGLKEVVPEGRVLHEGDEILVQVIKDAIKTKEPAVTMKVCLALKYLVFTKAKSGIGISNKVSRAERERLKELSKSFESTAYGIILRTNAAKASDEEILGELKENSSSFAHILEHEKERTCYSCLYQAPPDYIGQLRDYGIDRISQIVTDKKEVYDTIFPYLSDENQSRLRLYQDDMLSLSKLYSFEAKLSEALNKKVWLKSGGYLVIEQTETLTVIDVNTGKFAGKKTSDETFFRINMEAAKESARQIRLRNLSGMILIDFINLENGDKEQEMISTLKEYLKQDPVKTDFIDITGLKLVEITRRKVKRSIKEQF